MNISEITIIKGKIKPEHIGKDVFFVLGMNGGKLSEIDYGVKCNAHITEIEEKRVRSYEQLSLYWVGCRFIADISDDKNFDTEEKVDEQCKINARYVKAYLYYHNQKTGEKTLHLVTDSISYAKLKHLDACAYFMTAFQYQTDIYNLIYHTSIDVKEYTEVVLKQYIKNNYNAAMGLK